MESGKILVVEDNPAIRKALERILERSGYRVFTACDGKEAIELLSGELPDLIMSDIMMPNMNGYELYKNLMTIPKLNNIPFIFLTALDEERDIRTGKELGVDDYITKPFKREDVLSIVKGKLRRKFQIKENNNREVEDLKKEIFMTLSHEFRTPLTIIQGFTSLLLNDDLELKEDQLREFLIYIKAGGDRLEELIQDFIVMVEIDSGMLEKEIAKMRNSNDINSVIQILMEKYSPEALKKGINLVVEMEPDLPSLVFSPKHISVALDKIIQNAFKFCNKEKGFVKIRSSKTDNRAFLEIYDNGEGIPEYEFSNIYKRFYQIERKKKEQPGSGLGLSIAKSYIEFNSGTLSLKSEVGKGSTFIVSLPIEEHRH